MAVELDLSGRRAWVSGVSSGIGLGIAELLACAGCDVAGCGNDSNDSEGVERFYQAVQRYNRRARYDRIDLSKPEGPAQWIQNASEHTASVDILISNAGRNIFRGVQECTEADWAECMNLDLASHWRLAKAAHTHLAKGKNPVMIIMGSNHAYSTMPGCFPYNVAKAGLTAMVQSLAIEWGPMIRAVGIAPGFIDTPGNSSWFASFPDPAAERKRTEMLHPVNRIGTVQEIGGLCVFLASPWASFISGSTILIDGGRSAFMKTPEARVNQ